MLSSAVLVLNRNYQPVHVTRARRAISMVYIDVARVVGRTLEAHDFATWVDVSKEAWDQHLRTGNGHGDFVRTTRLVLLVPRVVLLGTYDRPLAHRTRFTRRNIYLRDDHTCQYCGETLPPSRLNLDHVLPRSRGGRSTWQNVVCACVGCNGSKGDRTPEEAAMPLLRRPRTPDFRTAVRLTGRSTPYREWRPFLPAEETA